jgi:hypothetical protein
VSVDARQVMMYLIEGNEGCTKPKKPHVTGKREEGCISLTSMADAVRSEASWKGWAAGGGQYPRSSSSKEVLTLCTYLG